VILFAGDPRRESARNGLPPRFLARLHETIVDEVRSVDDVDLFVASGVGEELRIDGPRPLTTFAPTVGAKVGTAFAHAVAAGYERVAIVAGDVVGLTAAILREALTTSETAIGRSPDGGFYLLACSAPLLARNAPPAIDWEVLPWYTNAIFDAIVDALRCEPHRLPDLADVDSLADALRVASTLTRALLHARVFAPPRARHVSVVAIPRAELRGPPLAA
jgi:hypothetical protein